MEDKNTGKKPLRRSSNAARDLKDTYLKNQSRRNIPISDPEELNEEEDNKEMESEQILENEEITEAENNEENATEQEVIDESEFSEGDEVVLLLERVKKLENEKKELKDSYLRKSAEVENIRRRTNKEKQEILEYGNLKLLGQLLEIIDDIGNAIDSGKKSKDYDALLTGLDMIFNKSKKIFENAGVTEMEDPVGKEFNVDYHDAMMQTPSGLPENYVVQQIQKGYMVKDKVLRHAKVVTSSGQAPEKNENE